MHRFVPVDHDTPMLLPPDLRAWVPEDHIVHFIMDAIAALKLDDAKVNTRGTGSAQYPPSLMLGLLIYSYATGTFSSRKIEALTHDSVAVRYLCAQHHPDHDSICKFRRENGRLLESSFHQVLELAARTKVLKVGQVTLAIDGTKILANASKHSAVSHGHATEQMKLLSEEIAQLLAKAEAADSTPLQDGLSIPEEVKRRQERIAKLKEAVTEIERRATERTAGEKAAHEAQLQERATKEAATGKKPRGRAPKPPTEGPQPGDQLNLTDPESRIMPMGGSFEQSYNAQAAVDTEPAHRWATSHPSHPRQAATRAHTRRAEPRHPERRARPDRQRLLQRSRRAEHRKQGARPSALRRSPGRHQAAKARTQRRRAGAAQRSTRATRRSQPQREDGAPAGEPRQAKRVTPSASKRWSRSLASSKARWGLECLACAA